jgi:leucyl-tRNA synthetase
VDYYVGGVEHAVLHLLYARFYTKFLYDIGVVDFLEPFKKLFNQGMITRFGHKMDKSGDNGVSPDDMINRYGCDSLRMYELFVGPPELDCEWDDKGIEGVSRFLNKVWKLADSYRPTLKPTDELIRLRHKLAFDITQRIENLSLNTVVSGFMEHTNTLTELAKTAGGIDRDSWETLIILLAPFAPHISEELWQTAGHDASVFNERWPSYDIEKTKTRTVEIAIQQNGKLRGNIEINADAEKEAVLKQAREYLAERLKGQEIVKEIYVPGKIVNFVVKG